MARELGCGDTTAARETLETAERVLFRLSEEAVIDEDTRAGHRQLRAPFYPRFTANSPHGIVTDPAECARVLASYGRRADLRRLRTSSDSSAGLRFSLVRLGPYYHLSLAHQPLVLDGGVSPVADRRTLRWNPATHQEF